MDEPDELYHSELWHKEQQDLPVFESEWQLAVWQVSQCVPGVLHSVSGFATRLTLFSLLQRLLITIGCNHPRTTRWTTGLSGIGLLWSAGAEWSGILTLLLYTALMAMTIQWVSNSRRGLSSILLTLVFTAIRQVYCVGGDCVN